MLRARGRCCDRPDWQWRAADESHRLQDMTAVVKSGVSLRVLVTDCVCVALGRDRCGSLGEAGETALFGGISFWRAELATVHCGPTHSVGQGRG